MSAQPQSHCASILANTQKYKSILLYLDAQSSLMKTTAPGVVPLISWFILTIVYWGLSGYIIWYAQYPTPSDDDYDSYDLHMKRSRSVSIALIIYFSLCILIMFYYFYIVLSLSKNQLTFFFPENQVWSVVSQGVLIGFFTICGLFSSIMCLLYFYDINTNAAVFAVMSLLGISLSVIVGLAFSAYLRCQVGESFSASEIECVKEFLQTMKKQATLQASASQQTANALKSRAESFSKMGLSEMVKEAVTSGDSQIEASRRALVSRSPTFDVQQQFPNIAQSSPVTVTYSQQPQVVQPIYSQQPIFSQLPMYPQQSPQVVQVHHISNQGQSSGVNGILAGAFPQ
jgi:hypothetical protein